MGDGGWGLEGVSGKRDSPHHTPSSPSLLSTFCSISGMALQRAATRRQKKSGESRGSDLSVSGSSPCDAGNRQPIRI